MNEVPFPLFHGTSTLFAERILKSGLGAHDPVAELNAVACLSRLVAVGDAIYGENLEWQGESYPLRLIANQSITAANFNFRHGSAYLSPSQETAVRYAVSNSHGSEIVSASVALFKRLCRIAPLETRLVATEFPKIYELVSAEFEPVLFRADIVAISSLCTEDGERNVLERIEWLSSFDEPIRAAMSQQTNFEVVATIATTALTAWRIKAQDGHRLSAGRHDLAPYEPAT